MRGLVRQSSDLSLLYGTSVELAVGSLETPKSLLDATRDIEIVYHVAAKVNDWGPLKSFRQVNVYGTKNLLDAAIQNEVKTFVYVSSVAVHSFIGSQNMNEQSPQLPTHFPYCRSKREAETLVREYHNNNKIVVTIVRPGDVYGPGDRTFLLKIGRMLEEGRMVLIGSGNWLGAFVYVENLANGLILAGTLNKAAGRTYIITDGIKLTWREYFERLTSALGVSRSMISVNTTIAYSIAFGLELIYSLLRIRRRPPLTRYIVARMSKDFCFNIDKAKRDLKYVPDTDIDKAIEKTAEWYKKEVRK